MTFDFGIGFGEYNGAGLTDTIADFPYDIDFVNNVVKGGFQIYGNNNNDGRFFRDSGNFQACYVEDANGLLVAQATSGMRRTSKGACLYPDVAFLGTFNRDLTNVGAWSATGITPLKNQIGANNGANAASSITATAPNGTILQTVTSSVSDRVLAVYPRRLVGSGPLEMTLDGVTFAPVTVGGSYAKSFITQVAVANPVYGFRVPTSGDSFAVDCIALHGPQNGLLIPSGYTPPTTTGTPIGTLSHSVPWALNTDAGPLGGITRGAFAFFWQGFSDRSVGQGLLVSDGFDIISGIAGNNIRFGAGVNLDTVDGSWRPGLQNKVAGYKTSSGAMALCVNGGTPVTRGGGLLSPSATHYVVSSNGSGNAALHGFVQRHAIGANLTFSLAGLSAMTA